MVLWFWASDLTSRCLRFLVYRMGSDYQPQSRHCHMDSKWTNTFRVFIPRRQAHCKRLVKGGCCHGYYSRKFFNVADKDALSRHLRIACIMGFWPWYQRTPSRGRLKRKRQFCRNQQERSLGLTTEWKKKSKLAEKCMLHDTIYVKNPSPIHKTTMQFLHVCTYVQKCIEKDLEK